MAIKKSKKQKLTPKSTPKQRTAQILFALFALILIISMVLTAISKL